MLKVQGRPILEHIIEGLAATGIREFCLVTGWRADVIEAYFGDGSRWGLRIACVRQVVHHMADSHSHIPIRFRLALTEDEPTPKGYDTNKWAELPDAKTGPIELRLGLLGAVQAHFKPKPVLLDT
jgi:hypothetical protein